MFGNLPKTVQTAIIENLLSNEEESNLVRGMISLSKIGELSLLKNHVESLVFTLNSNVTFTNIDETDIPISDKCPIIFTELPMSIKRAVLERVISNPSEPSVLRLSDYLTATDLAAKLGQKLMVEQYSKMNDGTFALTDSAEIDDFHWTAKGDKLYLIFNNDGKMELTPVAMNEEEMSQKNFGCYYALKRVSAENDQIVDCYLSYDKSKMSVYSTSNINSTNRTKYTVDDLAYPWSTVSEESKVLLQDFLKKEICKQRLLPESQKRIHRCDGTVDCPRNIADKNGIIIKDAWVDFMFANLKCTDGRDNCHHFYNSRKVFLEDLPVKVIRALMANAMNDEDTKLLISFRSCGCDKQEIENFLEREKKRNEKEAPKKQKEAKKKYRYSGR